MTDTWTSLTDTQLVGFLLMVKFLLEAEKKVGEDYLKGSFLWARHHSDPEFVNETEALPVGTGKFCSNKQWYLAYVPAAAVPLPAGTIGNCLLLTVFVEGKEKTALLTMDEILKIA